MIAHRIKAHVRANEPLVLALPKDAPAGEVEVIVIYPESPIAQTGDHSLRSFDHWLQQQPPGQRTQAEIDRQIEEERSTWDRI